jgi:Ni/Fe-hydrogenase 1 B-type cytochrome subunit
MAKSQVIAERHPLAFRVTHLAILSSILILVVTGFYIHRPFIADGGGFLMSLTRGVHFFAAGVLMVTTLLRLISNFIGRKRDWRHFMLNGRDLAIIPRVIAHYLHLADMPEIRKKYNPLQMIAYYIVLLMIIFQAISGFALQYPDGWLSGFNYAFFTSEVATRLAHYIITWGFVLFLMIHLYIGIREALVEIKAMVLLQDIEGEEQVAKE